MRAYLSINYFDLKNKSLSELKKLARELENKKKFLVEELELSFDNHAGLMISDMFGCNYVAEFKVVKDSHGRETGVRLVVYDSGGGLVLGRSEIKNGEVVMNKMSKLHDKLIKYQLEGKIECSCCGELADMYNLAGQVFAAPYCQNCEEEYEKKAKAREI